MDIDTLKQILDLVREHELSELEVEQDGLRLKVRSGVSALAVASASVPAAVAAAPAASAAAPPPAASTMQIPTAVDEADIELAVVKSPIVGTFYRSPERGAPSFVDVGATVKKGQVLCIIEAMKLMNESDSEYDGEIAAVYVESGQSVQYGERLFAIRTR